MSTADEKADDKPALPAGYQRSILISFDEDGTKSDIEFAKRLADLRGKFPKWRVRGIAHEGALTFIPRPPANGSNAAASREDDDDERQRSTLASSKDHVQSFLIGLDPKPGSILCEEGLSGGRYLAGPSFVRGDAQKERENDDCGSDVGSDVSRPSSLDSVGNVAGEKPQTIRRGMIFQRQVPPRVGAIGTVIAVKSSYSFQLEFEDKTTWWCGKDDVTFVSYKKELSPEDQLRTKRKPVNGTEKGLALVSENALRSNDGPVPRSTLEENCMLKRRLQCTQQVLLKALSQLSDEQQAAFLSSLSDAERGSVPVGRSESSPFV